MRKRRIVICILMSVLILNRKRMNGVYAYQTSTLDGGTVEAGENAGEMTVEELDEYLLEYGSYNISYKTTLIEEIDKRLRYYFPNMEDKVWKITGKKGNGHIVEFYSLPVQETSKYRAEFLINPDFSVELLENTIEVNPNMGMCICANGKKYVYHGCRIVEYEATGYNDEKDVYMKAVIPLFSMEQNSEWDGINRSIWESLDRWFNGEMDCSGGELSLDYEIKELNGDLYSILLSGEFRNDNGSEKHMAMGITVSIASGSTLTSSVFTKECAGSHDFYIEDGGLYFIRKVNRNDISEYVGKVEFLRYGLKRQEGQVYAANGRWIGQCYYELIEVEGYSDGIKKINQHMKEDMGKFFREVRVEFEKQVLEKDEGVVYGDANDYETILGSPGYHCYVRSENCYNNDGEFGVVYHYRFCLDTIHEEGDAVAVYDLESGELLKYQDWQKEVLEELSH